MVCVCTQYVTVYATTTDVLEVNTNWTGLFDV